MKSREAEWAFKFMAGAVIGFGAGWPLRDSILASPLLIGLWIGGIVAAGFLGVRVFNVAGKFPVVPEGEGNRLSPAEEVMVVTGWVLLGVMMGLFNS